MQRPFSLVPAEIMFLAAGRVRVHEFRRVKDVWEEPQFHGPGVARDTVSGVRSREQSRDTLMLEVLLAGGKARYSVLTDELDFAFLSGRRTTDPAANFNLLVRELAAFAPNAGLNRGAFQLTQTIDEVIHYPSKAAFFEEITWMLWRIARMSTPAGS